MMLDRESWVLLQLKKFGAHRPMCVAHTSLYCIAVKKKRKKICHKNSFEGGNSPASFYSVLSGTHNLLLTQGNPFSTFSHKKEKALVSFLMLSLFIPVRWISPGTTEIRNQ